MPYGDDIEREFTDRMHHWRYVRWHRELDEVTLPPDARLDDLGWEIFYCAVARGMDRDRAAEIAMNGNLRQRQRVAEDMWRRHAIALQRRMEELQPLGANVIAFDTCAPEQLAFWRSRLSSASFVYFIQDGEHGPVKIGLSQDPERRLPKLQTGNPRELLLRHVIPGDRTVEHGLHTRFAPARIRREWFGGPEYLPIILAFAAGLADRMVNSYDGSGIPAIVAGANVRTDAEVQRIRRDIERRWLNGFQSIYTLAEFLWLDEQEIEDHLIAMSKSAIWDIPRSVGQAILDDRDWRDYVANSAA
jgi:hypothetical protein